MTSRSASGYSPGFWGTCTARLAQGRVPKWCLWGSSGAGGALRITGVVWSKPISQLHPRNPSQGLAFCPTLKGVPGADVCQVGSKAESGRAGAHGSDLKLQGEVSVEPDVSSSRSCLFLGVLGGIQTATNHRHVLNRNLRPKQHPRRCSLFSLELG